MSYIQIKDLGGKDRGLKFNQMALEIFHNNFDMNAINSSSVYATFYGGLMANSYAKKEDASFTFEDVVDWVDELLDKERQSEIALVDECFAATQSYKRFLAVANKAVDDEKKKTEKLT